MVPVCSLEMMVATGELFIPATSPCDPEYLFRGRMKAAGKVPKNHMKDNLDKIRSAQRQVQRSTFAPAAVWPPSPRSRRAEGPNELD